MCHWPFSFTTMHSYNNVVVVVAMVDHQFSDCVFHTIFSKFAEAEVASSFLYNVVHIYEKITEKILLIN